MRIVVIGGSYFLGKAFVKMACENNEVFVFNRGNRPLDINGVTEIKGDRCKKEDLDKLKELKAEIIVDTCAYNRGDIESVVQAIGSSLKQYIFISTVDVYTRGTGAVLDENSKLEIRDFGGEQGSYILGKVSLEKEIIECANKYNFCYTVMRPAFIYGPDNYAPREEIYFYWIEKAGQIIHPMDATGEFQMVFVEDVARAINNAIGNELSLNQSYNLTGEKMENYDSFADVLDKINDIQIERVPVTVEIVNEKGIPLPFPLTKEESNWYNGDKALSLIGEYTSLLEGMRRTANIRRLLSQSESSPTR